MTEELFAPVLTAFVYDGRAAAAGGARASGTNGEAGTA
jgi:hypothetical protein